jgi:hypothetical protein
LSLTIVNVSSPNIRPLAKESAVTLHQELIFKLRNHEKVNFIGSRSCSSTTGCKISEYKITG